MGKGVLRSMNTAFARLFYREGESKTEQMRKKLLMTPVFVLLLTSTSYLISNLLSRQYYAVGQQLLLNASLATFIIYVGVTKRLSLELAEFASIGSGLPLIFGNDIRTYGMFDYYTAAVVLMDVLLLLGSGNRLTNACTAIIAMFIVVQSAEQCFRYGLYDALPKMSTQEKPEGRTVSDGATLISFRLLVFFLDFRLTQHFAQGMWNEKQRMERAINVSEKVAAALVEFDLEKGSELVAECGGYLPEQLLEALKGLLHNLSMYRPYLPQSCLPKACAEDSNPDSCESRCSVFSGNNQSPGKSSETSSAPSLSSKDLVLTAPSTGVTVRHLSFIALNLTGFVTAVRGTPTSAVASFYSSFLQKVMEEARSSRGLCDTVSGDRITCTFNGAKPCPSHRLSAVDCAMSLAEEVKGTCQERQSFAQVGVSMGVASGEALCGPLGCEELMRYAMIGPVSSWVYTVERLAVHHGVPVLVCQTTRGPLEHHYHFRLVDLKLSPLHGERFSLWYPTHAKDMEADEWMYQLEKAGDRWGNYNKVLKELLLGRVKEAAELGKELDGSAAEESLLLARIEKARRAEALGSEAM